MARAGLAILLGLAGCSGRGTPVPPSAQGNSDPSSLPDTIARVAAPLPNGRGVVLAGQRRTGSGGSDAWVAAIDIDGRLVWEVRVGDGFAWAEDLIVDPAGSVHVFGRDIEANGWFLSLDADGGRRGYASLPAGERLGFGRVGTQVQLFIAEPRDPIDADLCVLWLRMDWARPQAEPEQAKLELELFLGPSEWPEIEPLGPMLLEIDRKVHRVEPRESGEGFRSKDVDGEPFDEAEIAIPSPPERLETIALPILELESIDLGRRELLLLQLPPSAGADASVLLQAMEKPVSAEVRAAFAAHTARPPASSGSLVKKSEHHWAWLWPFVEHDVEHYANDMTLAAWLSAGTCDPVNVVTDCDRKIYEYHAPSYFAPDDPCWSRAQLEYVLGTFGQSVFRANFDAFVQVMGSSYFYGPGRGGYDQDYQLEDPFVDTLFDVAHQHGMTEQLIRAMFFDLGDHSARFEAIERLETLPLARREQLARALLSELRHDRERCAEVVELTKVLEAGGRESVAWEADLGDACDVLYVLCTGLQPGLVERVVGPRGIEHVAKCGDDRPTTKAEAEYSLLSICEPETWRSATLDYEISSEIAASCGTNAALLELRYSCGVSDDFDRLDVELATGPDGHVVIERIHILRTSVD